MTLSSKALSLAMAALALCVCHCGSSSETTDAGKTAQDSGKTAQDSGKTAQDSGKTTTCTDDAGALDGLRWELPCTAVDNPGRNCYTAGPDGGIGAVITATMSGTAGRTYDVTLHFRGAIEEKGYSDYADGGASDLIDGGANAGLFVSGGTPSGSSRWTSRR
jgi:hypothetical protein